MRAATGAVEERQPHHAKRVQGFSNHTTDEREYDEATNGLPMLIEISCPTPTWQCCTYPTVLKLLGKKGEVALKNQELPENGSSARLRCFLGVLRGEFLPRAPRYYWKYEFQAIDSDEEAGYLMHV